MPDERQPPVFPYNPGPFDPKIEPMFMLGLVPRPEWVAANQTLIDAGIPVRPPPANECDLQIVFAVQVTMPSPLAMPDGQARRVAVPVQPMGALSYRDVVAKAKAAIRAGANGT